MTDDAKNRLARAPEGAPCDKLERKVYRGKCSTCGSVTQQEVRIDPADDLKHHPPGRRYVWRVMGCDQGHETKVLEIEGGARPVEPDEWGPAYEGTP